MEGRLQSRELLDVPGVANIERTLANLTRSKPSIGPAPRSSVLDRLGAFLPQLAQANAQLEQQLKDQPPSAFDIEHVEEEDGPYIEMDLACGVLELRDEAALRAAEEAMEGRRAVQGGLFGGGQTVESDDDDDSDSDSDEDSSSSSDEDGEEEGEGAAARSFALAAAAAALARGAGAAGQSGKDDSGMECDDGDGGGPGVGSASTRGADERVEGAEAGVGRGGGGHGAGSAGKGRPAKSGSRAGGMAGKGGAQQGRRRKVAAKRSNMIVELS